MTPKRIYGTEQTHDASADVTAAIEELTAEYGVKAVVSACLTSSGAEAFASPSLSPANSLRVIQVLIHRIAYAKDPRLEAEIIALGAGVLLNDGPTMTEIGRRYGLTRAAISRRVVKFCAENNLPPSSFMRAKKKITQ